MNEFHILELQDEEIHLEKIIAVKDARAVRGF